MSQISSMVVSNTSPLTNLAVIGRLELVRSQFGQVAVPVEVWEEIEFLPHVTGRAALVAARKSGWLSVVGLADTRVLSLLMAGGLDAGESAAIALALERNASRLIIDERKGRAAATSLRLPVVGALGILAAACKLGQIPSVRPEIARLRADAGFFVTPEVEKAALEMSGE